MKKLFAILLFTLISVPASGMEFIVKEIRISPTTEHRCVSNGREFASGEFLVELGGKPESILKNGVIKLLFNNWYHLTMYLDCKGTIRMYNKLKTTEGVKRIEYNYIMKDN